jgi:hypothetical protein
VRELVREARLGARLGDDDRAGGRDDERRDLAHEAVADREDRVGPDRAGEVHALDQGDADAADQVDGRDDEAGHGVAAHELRGAVHGAVELRLAPDLVAARLGLVGRDQAVVELGVDRHLLAGHRVEGEARGHLADAPGALRDHELDLIRIGKIRSRPRVAADHELPNDSITRPRGRRTG